MSCPSFVHGLSIVYTRPFQNTGYGAIQVLRNADGGGGVSDLTEKSVTKV